MHYDPPEDHKAYIHRSGRTARAGSQGVVLSIIQPEQQKNAKKLQRRLGINESIREINPDELPDIEPRLKEERQEKARHEHKRGTIPVLLQNLKGKNLRTGKVKGLRRNAHRIKNINHEKTMPLNKSVNQVIVVARKASKIRQRKAITVIRKVSKTEKLGEPISNQRNARNFI